MLALFIPCYQLKVCFERILLKFCSRTYPLLVLREDEVVADTRVVAGKRSNGNAATREAEGRQARLSRGCLTSLVSGFSL